MEFKHLFENRTPREKNLMIWGAVVFIIFLLYQLIWQPIVSKYESLKSDLIMNQELLAFMQEKEPLVLQRRTHPSLNQSQDLFLLVDDNFKKRFNKEDKPEISRLSSNKVSVKFSKVSFDELLQSLGTLFSSYQIDVDSLDVNQEKELGMVQATVVLSR